MWHVVGVTYHWKIKELEISTRDSCYLMAARCATSRECN